MLLVSCRVLAALLHGGVDVVACDEAAIATSDILGERFAIFFVHTFHVLQQHALHQLPPPLHVHVGLMDEDVAATGLTAGCGQLSEEAEALADVERLDDSDTEGQTRRSCIATIVWRGTSVQLS